MDKSVMIEGREGHIRRINGNGKNTIIMFYKGYIQAIAIARTAATGTLPIDCSLW